MSSIIGFLDELTPHQRESLYQSPWTCQAVFRSLPVLAKNYVLRLLLIDSPVPQDVVNAWVLDPRAHGPAHSEALQRLLQMNLLLQGSTQASSVAAQAQPAYQLHPTFQSKLQWALSTGGKMLEPAPEAVLSAAPRREALDSCAHEQWESLQMYILDPATNGPRLPKGVRVSPLDFHTVLINAGLIVGKQSDRRITDAGFQFLLRDSHRQLWVFLAQYIRDTAALAESNLPPLISFLMQLGFMRVGMPYALSQLGHMEAVVAGHMMQLGVLLPFQYQGSLYFCPTRLASSLCSGARGGVSDLLNTDVAGGHIIVESNYKVNAWTTSRVQRSLLGLFCRCEASLPNFWVGALTHDSVNSALSQGISAEEIISYLQAHAHPQIANRKPIIPENVSDQVRLWEAETRRMRDEKAVFYDSFENRELFTSTLEFATARGLVLWSSVVTMALAAKEEGHDRIREYIRSVKAAQAHGAPIPNPLANL